jgi:hypothetical protein
MKIKNGKIVIIADTIEEARADLEMIEALSSIGAVSGQGSSLSGKAEIEMASPLAMKMINAINDNCCCCGCCCCDDDDDEWDCDDYEDDDFEDVYDDEIIGGIDEEKVKEIFRKMMGL